MRLRKWIFRKAARAANNVARSVLHSSHEEEATLIGSIFHELVSAKVSSVIDGDTVDVRLSCGDKIRIRLSAIDCPENGQEWGVIAKSGLIKLIGGRYVHLELHGTDDKERAIATIYVDNKGEFLNVNERMVMLGHAWVMRRYYRHLSKERQSQFNQLENWAKSKRVGLWQSENPIPPWRWRNSESE